MVPLANLLTGKVLGGGVLLGSGRSGEKRQRSSISDETSWKSGGDIAHIDGSGGSAGSAFISCGTLFFNFSCLAGDIGFGASIGDSERDINFLGN